MLLVLSLVASFACFLQGLYHLVNGIVLGRSEHSPSEAAFFFTAFMFGAAILFHLGSHGPVSFFEAIQMAGANKEFETPKIDGFWGVVTWLYGLFIYICAPASTILLITTYASELLSRPLVKWRSRHVDTFVFSSLDERSLRVARSINDYYQTLRDNKKTKGGPDHSQTTRSKYPCIVFSSVDTNLEEDLSTRARSIGAICTARDTETVLKWCSDKTICTVFLSSENEVENISLAQRIKQLAAQSNGRFDIFALTSLRNSETLIFPEVLAGNGAFDNRVVVRGVDITRELVGRIIELYPLFLVGNPHTAWLPENGGMPYGEYSSDVSSGETERIRDLYQRDRRHILVVGAGDLGMEFACSALWASRIDGIHTCIDVIDREMEQGGRTRSAAEARFNAMAPEIASRVCERWSDEADRQDEVYDLHFSCMDVESDAFTSFLVEHASTITYVLVALGDDVLDAKVAMRTRQVLERELVRRCAKMEEHERESYLNANRPLVIAVIEDSELAGIIENARNENQPYDIVCVGRMASSPTYEGLLHLRMAKNEYDRRSNRANATHRKYRLFAWLRNAYLGRCGVERLSDEDFLRMAREIDWTSLPSLSWEAVRHFERYRLSEGEIASIRKEFASAQEKGQHETSEEEEAKISALAIRTHPLKESEEDEGSRQWLLEMEHARWNAYIRSEGFVMANIDEVIALFDTGQVTQGAKLHRSNLVGMHPCLVSFDELEQVSADLQALYTKKDPNRNIGDMRLLDDKYVGFFGVYSLQDAETYLDILVPSEMEAGRQE